MMNLQTYFENNFDDKQISNDELKTFTEDHLRRLAENNTGGALDEMLLDTTTRYTDFFGDITDTDTAAAVRQGLTISVNNTMDAFFARVSRREGRIRDLWGKESAEHQEFFPHGVDEYGSADLSEAERLMNQFVAAADAHKGSTELGQAFYDEFFALRQAFRTARAAQLGKKGAVSSGQSDTKTSKTALEKQLMKNLLLLAAQNVGDISKAAVYFDQSIIRPAQSHQTDTPTP